MRRENIKQYYGATKNSETRSDLIFAVQRIEENNIPKIAIDSGCGAGADIEYLLQNDFTVHAFDIEDEAVSICENRFNGNKNVFLSQNSFSSFAYPKTSLVLADASLFFCPKNEFSNVWSNMYKCLMPKGVFCGSFLGTEDSMAAFNYDKNAFWPDILVFDEKAVREIFKSYKIYRFTVHNSSGINTQGEPHQWHIFSVVAKKQT